MADVVLAAFPIAPGVVGAGIQTVRQGDNLIQGTAQATKQGGEATTHASTSERIAGEMAASGNFTSVHMNQTANTITDGAANSAVRPDVAGVRADNGKVDVVEVLSPGQKATDQIAKNERAFGDRLNAATCVDPDKC